MENGLAGGVYGGSDRVGDEHGGGDRGGDEHGGSEHVGKELIGKELIGRQRERALLERVLESARAGACGSATVLRGEAGIGKTALLDWAADRAARERFTVLRAGGSEAETGLAFGVLHQVLRPLLAHSRALPARQRAALESALGLRDPSPSDGFRVGASALALLAEEARHRPVLVLVDDLHWVDSSSAAVLAFLRQRIADLPVAMVCASRPVDSAPEGWPVHPVDVEALTGEDSRALLRRWHPELAATTARRVMDEAAGNPLALAELPGQLGDEHRRGVLPLPERLPLGQRLEEIFARRIRSLPPEVTRALLLTALDGAGAARGDALAGPLPGQDRAERILVPIEASGLARLDHAGCLVFRHPLVRSAVIASASEAERRAAHRTLAERLRADDPRRLLHEASAAEGPDERLAARLQEAGTRMALRGGDAEGALLLVRAASLSAGADNRARRLTWAAVMSARGGRLAYAAKLVAELQRARVPEDVAPLLAYAVVYVDQSHHVDFGSSFALLPPALAALTASEEAGTEVAGAPSTDASDIPVSGVPTSEARASGVPVSDARAFGVPVSGAPASGVPASHTLASDIPVSGAPVSDGPASHAPASHTPAFEDLVEQMFFKLLLASTYTDDPRGWETLERYREHVSPMARLCHRAWADPPRTAHGAEDELRSLVAHRAARQETGHAWLLLWAASAVDSADAELWWLSGGEHAYATQGSVAKARCHQDFLRGRWDAARDCLREADTAEELGYHCNALLFRHYHAHFLAGRGDERGLREARARIEPAARKARMRFVTDHLDHLGALVALAHGRYEDAYARLRQMMTPGDLPRGLPWFHLPFFDFVYAAQHCGRRAEARAHVAAGRAARMGDISAHHAFLLAAAHAMTADGDTVDDDVADEETAEDEAVGDEAVGDEVADDDAPDDDAPDVDAPDDDTMDAAYEAAYAVPGADRWVFDLARLRLAHGSWLLRRGRRTEAADVLRAAGRAFGELRAEPWAEQCRSALRAADRAPDLAVAGPGALTPQEMRIARLVATGLTNKEVGAALHLSPRTIGAHLYRIFPKLGITSRAALARALPGDG
ncbi:AAA family ATPase [Streptomyces sp. NPDC003077]|uniref:helix-turn-helix transcriptional regulator n=1 Tax=Streptomyces sp. NPDC003077 TaxID=3154443 RepID=UPI0033A25D6F